MTKHGVSISAHNFLSSSPSSPINLPPSIPSILLSPLPFSSSLPIHSTFLICKCSASWPSSVASPICQEGQSERNFLIFAFSSWFFQFFSWFFFPDFSTFFPDFLANFSLSGVALCPPCHPSGCATILTINIINN